MICMDLLTLRELCLFGSPLALKTDGARRRLHE
jgi:hypothetical protein